jgi:hypothetical protein
MFVGVGYYSMFIDSSVDSLVIELVNELSSHNIMHVIKFHRIDAQVRRNPQILADMRHETLKPYKNPTESDLPGNPKLSPLCHQVAWQAKPGLELWEGSETLHPSTAAHSFLQKKAGCARK